MKDNICKCGHEKKYHITPLIGGSTFCYSTLGCDCHRFTASKPAKRKAGDSWEKIGRDLATGLLPNSGYEMPENILRGFVNRARRLAAKGRK